jgi:hypothetical protein
LYLIVLEAKYNLIVLENFVAITSYSVNYHVFTLLCDKKKYLRDLYQCTGIQLVLYKRIVENTHFLLKGLDGCPFILCVNENTHLLLKGLYKRIVENTHFMANKPIDVTKYDVLGNVISHYKKFAHM